MDCRCFLSKVLHYTLHIYATCYRIVEWWRVFLIFYCRSPSFAVTDLLLSIQYAWSSPYRWVRRFSSEVVYGETPLSTWDDLVKKIGLVSTDCVYDLGGGTGRIACWLAHFVGCRVVSIEQVPELVERARRVYRWRNLASIRFCLNDLFEVSFSPATWIYFYGTAADDAFIVRLCHKIAKEAPLAAIITISYPLSEWDSRFTHELIGEMTFPWGLTPAYINRLIREN